jgi:hypothetical protein
MAARSTRTPGKEGQPCSTELTTNKNKIYRKQVSFIFHLILLWLYLQVKAAIVCARWFQQ